MNMSAKRTKTNEESQLHAGIKTHSLAYERNLAWELIHAVQESHKNYYLDDVMNKNCALLFYLFRVSCSLGTVRCKIVRKR